MVSAHTVRFFFDYVSPYSYLAWAELYSLAERHRLEVEPVPVLFGGLVSAHGQKNPVDVPTKYLYAMKDAIRRARRLGVPFALPAQHPFNPLLALRVSSLPAPAAEQRARIDALFRATWAGGPGVSRAEDILPVLGSLGLDGARLIADAETPDGKARVRQATEQAAAEGVFGVPTLRIGDELFWGHDSLVHVEGFLRGEDPVDAAALERWNHARTGAQRPR